MLSFTHDQDICRILNTYCPYFSMQNLNFGCYLIKVRANNEHGLCIFNARLDFEHELILHILILHIYIVSTHSNISKISVYYTSYEQLTSGWD